MEPKDLKRGMRVNTISGVTKTIGLEDEIVKVESCGHTIWERKEPKYYIKPKGMDMNDGTCMNLHIKTNKWFSFSDDNEYEYIKNKFTIEEMIELGLDPDNFDKELVCSK